MKILVAGQGPMAKEQVAACCRRGISHEHIVEPTDINSGRFSKMNGDTVIIHFGTGRLMPYLAELSRKNKAPIIQGSSYELALKEMKECKDVRMIHAPNLCLPIAASIETIVQLLLIWKKFTKLEIVESHQSRKKDVSKTARVVGKDIGIEEKDILSVRKRLEQLAFGIAPEFIDAHAWHSFIAISEGVKLEVRTQIHGRSTYADGALTVGQALLDNPTLIDVGVTPLTDIIGDLT